MQEGYVESVDTETARSFLAEDAASGQPVLIVESGYEFLEAESVLVDGEVYSLLSVELGDLDDEDATSTLTLGTNLPALVEAGEPVDVSPEKVTTWAQVSIPPAVDTVTVRVPQSPQVTLPLGIRTPETREVVTYEDGIDGPEIVSIQGQAAIDATKLVGAIPAGSQPDPVAPASSPVPTVIGLVGQLLVMTTGVENATPVAYEYHLALSDASAPDASTLATESTSTGVSLTTLPDGTPEGTALEYDTDYYVAVVAKSGDQAAAPSAWVLSRLNRVGTADITAGSITGALISSIVNSSSLFRTAITGQRTENDVNGYRVYDSTGAVVVNLSPSEVVILADYMYAKFLETGGALLGGLTRGPAGGEFRLGTGILEAPGAALAYSGSTLEQVELAAFPDVNEDQVQTVAAADAIYTFYINSTSKKIICRRYDWGGTLISSNTVTELAGSDELAYLQGVALTSAALYVKVQLADDSYRLWRIPRTSFTTWSSRQSVTPPSFPGGSPYVEGDYAIGSQVGSNNLLVGHWIDGAQVIGSQSYADEEWMVRRFTPSTSGTIVLTLNQTIKSGVIALTASAPLMAEAGTTFDTPADSGKTSLILLAATEAFRIVNVPAGATVTATPALGASEWVMSADGYPPVPQALWDGTAIWENTFDTVAKRPPNDVDFVAAAMGYTYYNGVNETELSPPLTADIKTRYPSKWTIPTLPAGVDEVRLYLSADPVTRTRFERVGTFSGTPGQPLLIDTEPIEPPAGAATNPPPATSDYPGGDVYTITTADAETHMDGDGTLSARDPIAPTDVVNLRTLEDGAPVAITPTVGNAAATCAARMSKVGGQVTVRGTITFTGAATTTITLALPSTPASGQGTVVGTCQMRDNNVGNSSRLPGIVTLVGSLVIFQAANGSANVYAIAAAPWTWAINDSIDFALTYEEAV